MLDFKVGELLEKVSTGQMIRIVFLTPDGGDETGEIVEFENDCHDYRYLSNKPLFNEWVEWVSSTLDDYLRIEIIKGGRS